MYKCVLSNRPQEGHRCIKDVIKLCHGPFDKFVEILGLAVLLCCMQVIFDSMLKQIQNGK
jgi:hypothetical protein